MTKFWSIRLSPKVNSNIIHCFSYCLYVRLFFIFSSTFTYMCLHRLYLSVPTSTVSFCTYIDSTFLYLHQLYLSVPASTLPFCTYINYTYLYLHQLYLSVPTSTLPFCTSIDSTFWYLHRLTFLYLHRLYLSVSTSIVPLSCQSYLGTVSFIVTIYCGIVG